jgi:hypothetical protein
MPRIRTIRPDFRRSRSMSHVSLGARLSFIMLWLAADDAGRVFAHPKSLPYQLFPRDRYARAQVPGWMHELERQRCIERYTVDGTDYLSIANWDRYQKIYHPTRSRLPPPGAGFPE